MFACSGAGAVGIDDWVFFQYQYPAARSTTATTNAIRSFLSMSILYNFYVCALEKKRTSLVCTHSLKPSGFSVSATGKLPFPRPPSQFDSSKNMKIKHRPQGAVFDFVPSRRIELLSSPSEGDVLSIELQGPHKNPDPHSRHLLVSCGRFAPIFQDGVFTFKNQRFLKIYSNIIYSQKYAYNDPQHQAAELKIPEKMVKEAE